MSKVGVVKERNGFVELLRNLAGIKEGQNVAKLDKKSEEELLNATEKIDKMESVYNNNMCPQSSKERNIENNKPKQKYPGITVEPVEGNRQNKGRDRQ